LLGITRASNNRGEYRGAAALASPLAAEEAIQRSGVVLQPCGSAAAAEQQLLHVQGCATGSRDGRCGQDGDGKDSSLV
jgi:hypothetical protein